MFDGAFHHGAGLKNSSRRTSFHSTTLPSCHLANLRTNQTSVTGLLIVKTKQTTLSASHCDMPDAHTAKSHWSDGEGSSGYVAMPMRKPPANAPDRKKFSWINSCTYKRQRTTVKHITCFVPSCYLSRNCKYIFEYVNRISWFSLANWLCYRCVTWHDMTWQSQSADDNLV